MKVYKFWKYFHVVIDYKKVRENNGVMKGKKGLEKVPRNISEKTSELKLNIKEILFEKN